MRQTAETCAVKLEGQSSEYSLAMRIGIYTCITAIYISRFLLLSRLDVLRLCTYVFFIPIFVTTLIHIANIRNTFTVEIFILLQLLTWLCFRDIRGRKQPTRFPSRSNIFHVSATLILRGTLVGLNLWFWFVAIEQTKRGPCSTTPVFFFWKFDMLGWFRMLMKVISIIVGCLYLNSLFWIFLDFWSQEKFAESEDAKAAIMAFELSRTMQTDTQKQSQRSARGHSRSPSNSTIRTFSPFERQHSRSGSNASWGTISTLADDDNMSERVERIRSSMLKKSASLSSIKSFKDPSRHFHSPLFEGVYRGEQFLDDCIAAGEQGRLRIRYPRLSRLIFGKKTQPDLEEYSAYDLVYRKQPSYIGCVVRHFGALLTFHFPRHCAIIFHHLNASRKLNGFSSPFQVYAALTCSDTAPSQRCIAIASSIRLSRQKRPALPIVWAVSEIFKNIFVILQIELTIFWNGAGHSDRFDDVGQMIPVVLGASALIWAIWKSVAQLGETDDASESWDSLCTSDPWERRFISAYQEWKRDTGKQSD